MALLELRQIVKDFPGVRALDGVSLTLEPGQVHALCGENGAGKSTLIKILCGFYPAGSYAGELLVDGHTVRFQDLRDGEHAGIALIAQELALVPELSVAENLALGREPVRLGLVDWRRVASDARRALAEVGLDIDPQTPVKALGIGQQQLVEIAKALAKDARVLVLDEPTAALTEKDAHRLLELLRGLKARGRALLYISHRLEEVFEIADRITVLRDGRSVGSLPAAELDRDKVIGLMVGREVTTLFPRCETEPGATLLAIRNWRVADPLVPAREVVSDVSFELRAGEVLGLGGLMGAGRTALVSSLFGVARSPVRGTLTPPDGVVRGPFRGPDEAIAAGLALLSEDRKRYGLILDASVRENLTLAALRRFVRAGLPLLDHAARDEAAREQVAALRVKTPSLHVHVGTLSGGNQQKVVIGKWLIQGPRVLLLDEPTRGIDVGAKAEIYELIVALARRGLGVLLVSSELPELLGLAQRVIVLSQGRVAEELQGSTLGPERFMAAATRKMVGAR